MEDQGWSSKHGLLPVLSGGDVAHGSVDGDGPGVEAPHHLAHLLPVAEGVAAPQAADAVLEEAQKNHSLFHAFKVSISPPPSLKRRHQSEMKIQYLYGGVLFL